MSNTVIKIKRTSVAGRAANSTTLTNPGELALNMTDRIMYSTNGSVVFEIGANNTNVNVSNTLTVKSISANGSNGTAGHVLHSNGTSTYWAADDQGVTSVATGNGLTGGTITSTGTVSVLANSGIVANTTGVYVRANNGITANATGLYVTQGTGTIVNTTGVHVNSAYIATLAANSATGSLTNTFTVGTASYFVANGNVGIGNTTPFYKLDVAGTIRGQATAATGDVLIIGNDSKLVDIDIAHTAGLYSVTNPLIGSLKLGSNGAIISGSDGNIGIANTTPAHKLRVQGDISLSGGIHANGSLGTSGHVLHSNGTATYWAADDQGVTSVATGNGLTGGTITSTGTVSVRANTGIIANATGLYVNSAYIGTLSANNASFLGGTAAASYQLNSTLAANVATLASNSATYANGSITNAFTVGTGTYFVSNGNVGIGTATPTAKLDVNGSIKTNGELVTTIGKSIAMAMVFG